ARCRSRHRTSKRPAHPAVHRYPPDPGGKAGWVGRSAHARFHRHALEEIGHVRTARTAIEPERQPVLDADRLAASHAGGSGGRDYAGAHAETGAATVSRCTAPWAEW